MITTHIKNTITKLIKVAFLGTLLVTFFMISPEVTLAQPSGRYQADMTKPPNLSTMSREQESQLEIVAQAKVGDVTQLKLLDMGTGEVKGLALDKKFQPLSETRAELAVLREEAKEFTSKLEPELAKLASEVRSETELSSFEGAIQESIVKIN